MGFFVLLEPSSYAGARWILDCGAISDSLPGRPYYLGGLASGSDQGNSITTDAAGNLYVTGYFDMLLPLGLTQLTPIGSTDIFVVKMPPRGEALWAQQAGGSSRDIGEAITLDPAGNCYVTGVFQGTASFGDPSSPDTTLTSNGDKDIFVAKYDPSGQLLWAASEGGPLNDRGAGISTDAAGNCYVAGGLNLKTFVRKYSPAGNILWTQQSSGSGSAEGQGIVTNASGDTYLTGNFQNTETFGSDVLTSAGDRDIFISHINAAGNFVWTVGAGANGWDEGFDISIDGSGQLYVTGNFEGSVTFGTAPGGPFTSQGNLDLFVCKLNPAGVFQWATHAGTPNLDGGFGIATDAAGNSFVTGSFSGTISFGSTTLTSANGSFDTYVCRIDANGNFVWPQQAGGGGIDQGLGIALDGQGNAYVTGTFTGPISVGTPARTLVGAGGQDVLIWGLQLADCIHAIKRKELSQTQDADQDPANELQSLSLSTNQLMLDKGGSVDLSPYAQTLSLNTNQLSLSNGGSVDLSSYLDNTDNQALSLNSNQLTLTNGGSVTLPNQQDDLGNHTATQNIQLGSHRISGDGGNNGISVGATNGYVGINSFPPRYTLDLGFSSGRKLAVFRIVSPVSFYGFGFTPYLNRPNTLDFYSNAGSADDPDMVIDATGKVGIGTTNPQNGILEVSGTAGTYPITSQYGFLFTSGAGSNPSASNTYSIFASGAIAASDFNALSDRRIKNVQGVSNGSQDLLTLMQVQITDYQHIDTIQKGNTRVKKVIAQQIAKVYPQAVKKNLIQVVPDIYQRADLKDGWIMLATDLQAGERVKLITEHASEVYEVSAVQEDRFQVNAPDSRFSAPGSAFVYGREVDDFHTVDYEAISMLNVSATQEQQRRIEHLEKENAALQLKVEQLMLLESRLQALEAHVGLPSKERVSRR